MPGLKPGAVFMQSKHCPQLRAIPIPSQHLWIIDKHKSAHNDCGLAVTEVTFTPGVDREAQTTLSV